MFFQNWRSCMCVQDDSVRMLKEAGARLRTAIADALFVNSALRPLARSGGPAGQKGRPTGALAANGQPLL